MQALTHTPGGIIKFIVDEQFEARGLKKMGDIGRLLAFDRNLDIGAVL
jgi:hypothetical protein